MIERGEHEDQIDAGEKSCSVQVVDCATRSLWRVRRWMVRAELLESSGGAINVIGGDAVERGKVR